MSTYTAEKATDMTSPHFTFINHGLDTHAPSSRPALPVRKRAIIYIRHFQRQERNPVIIANKFSLGVVTRQLVEATRKAAARRQTRAIKSLLQQWQEQQLAIYYKALDYYTDTIVNMQLNRVNADHFIELREDLGNRYQKLVSISHWYVSLNRDGTLNIPSDMLPHMEDHTIY